MIINIDIKGKGLNLPFLPVLSSMSKCDPVILHYHDRVDGLEYYAVALFGNSEADSGG